MKELIKIILQLASNDMAAIRRYDSKRRAECFGLLGANIRGVVDYFKERGNSDPEFKIMLMEYREELKSLEGIL